MAEETGTESRPLDPNQSAPAFFGYLPPTVDGTLLSLVNTSFPGDPERESMSYATLTEKRFIALDLVETSAPTFSRMFASHVAAGRTVHQSIYEGRPYGLYLRNFALDATARPTKITQFGRPQVATIGFPGDKALQKLVIASAGAMPFVSIFNRAGYLDEFPAFVLGNHEWEAVASVLIRDAALVVVYFLTVTTGVSREFEMLREAHAQEKTLVIEIGEDPREQARDLFQPGMLEDLFGIDVTERTRPPPDFRHVMRYESAEGDAEVKAKIAAMVQKARASLSRELTPLPLPFLPSDEALGDARDRALQSYDEAMHHIGRGEAQAAEDALIRAIAYGHWAADEVGRAVSYLTLAGVEHKMLRYPREAWECYMAALRLLYALLERSPLARETYPQARRAALSFVAEHDDAKRAAWIEEEFPL
jgi:hypothetical protein